MRLSERIDHALKHLDDRTAIICGLLGTAAGLLWLVVIIWKFEDGPLTAHAAFACFPGGGVSGLIILFVYRVLAADSPSTEP
jgi:hypothetical protein